MCCEIRRTPTGRLIGEIYPANIRKEDSPAKSVCTGTDYKSAPAGESILREYKAGMFFTNGGEVNNFNLAVPTYKNIKLKKTN